MPKKKKKNTTDADLVFQKSPSTPMVSETKPAKLAGV